MLLSNFLTFYNEYYYAHDDKSNQYWIAHPKLAECVINMQLEFIQLPCILQERLCKFGFDSLIQCNNVVDLYSLRSFLVDSNQRYAIPTILERIDAELILALKVNKLGLWEKYSTLPETNLYFYKNKNLTTSDEISTSTLEQKQDIKIDTQIYAETDLNPTVVEKIQQTKTNSIIEMADKASSFTENLNTVSENTGNIINNIGKIITTILRWIK